MSGSWTIHDLNLAGGVGTNVGTTLIEASAGTGKTFTISGLVARLVAEGRATIDRILVVTFTRAATKELRERIRKRLAELLGLAEQALSGSGAFELPAEADAFVRDWYERVAADRQQLQLQRWRLARAVEDMDLAAISTIHGFCQRALRDRAFEGALSMDRELVQDVRDRIDQLLRDFAITRLHDEDAETVEVFLAWLIKHGGKVAGWVARDQAMPVLPSRAAIPPAVWDAAVTELTEASAALGRAWPGPALELFEQVTTHPQRNKGTVSDKLKRFVRPLGERLSAYAASGQPVEGTPDERKYASKILHRDRLSCFRKGTEPPEHGAWSLWERWLEAADELAAMRAHRLEQLRQEFVAHVRSELPRRMQRENVQSFDDLLADLHRAVTADGEAAARVVRALQSQYDAALIDEFQDTSPVQFEIFDRVFANAVPLFYIGDPKQAIYQFRGADVYAYLRAAKRADVRRTLGTNYRSDPGVLSAVNTLFGGDNAFQVEAIPYEPVAARPGRTDSFAMDGAKAPAVRVAIVDGPLCAERLDEPGILREDGKLRSDDAQRLVARWVADDIGQLLESRVTIGADAKPLRPGDVAVLVRSNKQGDMVQQQLRNRGIAAVRASSGNVFASEECASVLAIVEAIAEPSRAERVLRALATPVLGRTANDLVELRADDARWDALVDRFARWRRRWEDRGAMAALQELMRDEQVASRLLALPDGERRMTNLLHIIELVHAASIDERLGLDGVLRWITTRDGETESDTALLRTESEAEAVQIVTMHKAKGLEYAVAYCPYLWRPAFKTEPPVRVHDPANDHREVAVIGSAFADPDEGGRWMQLGAAEQRAENVRLAYVAITRAKHHAVLVSGDFHDIESSPLFDLLHAAGAGADAFGAAAAWEDVERWSEATDGAVAPVLAHETPRYERRAAQDEQRPELSALTVRRTHRSPWRIASFTSLIRGDRAPDAPSRDHDGAAVDEAAAAVAPVDDAKLDAVLTDEARLTALRGGTDTGTMVHAIFELAPFGTDGRDERRRVVEAQLARYGFDAAWADPIDAWVTRVLETPVLPEEFALQQLGRRQRLDELEFMLPVGEHGVAHITAAIAEAMRTHGEGAVRTRHADAIEALPPQALTGYLRGYIDLAFEHRNRWYVLDYKTNVLQSAASYRSDRLDEAMLHGMYGLQYHLYLVALHRYLQHRVAGYDPATHLGGALYLFVRGMHPALGAAAGVYADAPSPSLIVALDAALRGAE